ncbi:MAG: hypothetical protein RIS08_652 [Actinomycetota bacterium]|jgi:ribonuclease P protein component
MLPKVHRLTKSDEIRAVIRQGKRSSSPLATIHYISGSSRAAFVTPKTLGNAVTRNLVRRRSREILRKNIAFLQDYDLVVRLHPASAESSFSDLEVALVSCLEKLN